MFEQHEDGVDEALAGTMRVMTITAGRVGERLARFREEHLRVVQARSEREARELQLRFDSERAAARAELHVVQEPAWWGRADAGDVARVWEVASAWKNHDSDIAGHVEHIRKVVQQRYGFDPANVSEVTRDVLIATEEAARARSIESVERAKNVEERAKAVTFLAQADALDDLARENRAQADKLARNIEGEGDRGEDKERFTTAEQHTGAAQESAREAEDVRGKAFEVYDSADRREQFADRMQTHGATQEQVRDRLLADIDQAKHPREAVSGKRKTPKARRNRTGAGQTRVNSRGGR